MSRTYLEHKLPDGTALFEYFENDEIVGTARVETAASGKVTRREFDASGRLTEEFHNHGRLLGFAIIRKFQGGTAAEETYFRNRKLISRKTYIRHLAEFPDMPQPTVGLPDMAADLQALISEERRAQKAVKAVEKPDSTRAARLDVFCRELLRKGDVQDAKSWFDRARAGLGERDRRASRRLLNAIYARGAVRVWACDIQTEPDGTTGTNHLVVRLPELANARAGLLSYLARLARMQGLEGDPDDGQRYVYVKLD